MHALSFSHLVTVKLKEIRDAANPLIALATWFNSLDRTQRIIVLTKAEIPHPEAYCDHKMYGDGSDNILKSLAKGLHVGVEQ